MDEVRDDLNTLVLDADLLDAVLGAPDPTKNAKEVTIKLTARLRKHAKNLKFKALAERLEDLKNRHEQGLLVSIDFLKELSNSRRTSSGSSARHPRKKISIRGRPH